jgi:hypothetical protein
MRRQFPLAVFSILLATTIPACAYSPDEKLADADSISALQARILQAQPKEQCFLYAELMHQMTEFSIREYSAGNVDHASDLLKQIQQIAHHVHLSVAEDNKRLKQAEILLRHTAFRLSEMLHLSSFDDRPLVEQTLAQVNKAENDTMMQVFRK